MIRYEPPSRGILHRSCAESEYFSDIVQLHEFLSIFDHASFTVAERIDDQGKSR